MTIEKLFRAPYSVPNALQVTGEGLWVADQITDRVALVELAGPSEYGVTKLIRDIPSESSNTSGMAHGAGTLWLAVNGAATLWRPPRDADAGAGEGAILQVDADSGQTLRRELVPGGGGVHGMEYDHFEEGFLWVTTLKDRTLSKIRIEGWTVEHVIALPYGRAHGVVRAADGVWVVHTSERVIVKLDLESGAEMDRVVVPEFEPQPHGLSAYDSDLLYCDATSGWVVKVSLEHLAKTDRWHFKENADGDGRRII